MRSAVPDPRRHRPFDLPAGAYEAIGWTACDEQQAWDIADHWYAVADTVTRSPADARTAARRAAGEVVAALDGTAAAEFADAWRALDADDGLAPDALRDVGTAMGRWADGRGRDIEAAKLTAWVDIGRLAVDVLRLRVPAAAAPGAVAAAVAVRVAATRLGVREVFHRLDAGPGPADTLRRAVARSVPPEPLLTRHHEQVARYFARAAQRQRELARDAAGQAAEARRRGLPGPAEELTRLAHRAAAAETDLTGRARLLGGGAPDDCGTVPPAGGLRPPLAGHRSAVERAVPRDADGRVRRLADPRAGFWFALLNDGGPAADPTRATNGADAVLSLYDTYLRGRPRVASPRTFDAYLGGDPDRPNGGPGARARVEGATGGRFQVLCPDVGGRDPHDARRAVVRAFTSLHRHLLDSGHGSFACIAARTEGGGAHLWAAVNQHGTVLHLDPQCSVLVEHESPYGHAGAPCSGNVVLLDALVLDGAGRYVPLPSVTGEPGPAGG